MTDKNDAEILSETDIRAIHEAEKDGILAPPISYYSLLQERYVHWSDKHNKPIMLTLANQKNFLVESGLSPKKIGDEPINEVAAALVESATKYGVDYIGNIDCLGAGYQEWRGQKFYNLSCSALPPPEAGGSFPVIDAGLVRAFGRIGTDPFHVIRGWFNRHYCNRSNRQFDCPGLTLLLTGASSGEARVVQNMLTFLLTGRRDGKINPSPYLNRLNRTLTSPVLAGGGHWEVNSGLKNQNSYRQLIDAEEIFYEKDGTRASLPFGVQKSVFMENTVSELRKLPSLFFDLRDKVHLLLLQPLGTFRFDFKKATRELPYFISHIINYQVPAHLERGYIAPEILPKLLDASLAGDLLRTLSDSNIPNGSIKGEPEIGNIVIGANCSFRDRRNWEKETIGALLEIISKQCPHKIQRMDDQNWKLNLHDHEPTQPSSLDDK